MHNQINVTNGVIDPAMMEACSVRHTGESRYDEIKLLSCRIGSVCFPADLNHGFRLME
jgi:hypothetical protein